MKRRDLSELLASVLGKPLQKHERISRARRMGALAALAAQHGGLPPEVCRQLLPFKALAWPTPVAVSSEELVWAYEILRAHGCERTVGMHFTPTEAVSATLNAVSALCESSFQGRILDPACGAGAFFLGLLKRSSDPAATVQKLHGFDIDADAIALARLVVQLEVGHLVEGIAQRIFCVDALKVLGDKTFDLIIGNPPWVSYSGRHAAHLPAGRGKFLRAKFESFRSGWPSLHGAFMEASLGALADDGVLAFVVPQQTAELEGFETLRRLMRERLDMAEPLRLLPQTAFEGISTRAMVLAGREHAAKTESIGQPFSIATPRAAESKCDAIFARLLEMPKAPKSAFGDIGIHSGNAGALIFNREGRGVAVQEGADLLPPSAKAPTLFLDPTLRLSSEHYFRVGNLQRQTATPVLIRQTGRFPMAAVNQHQAAFRNSCLAGFGIAGWSPEKFAGWLNSSIIRWFHLRSVHESRQRAFPQVKVGALRNLPLPPALSEQFSCNTTHRAYEISEQELGMIESEIYNFLTGI